uniref:Uncharacterized protein n=1 Tax=Anguilla anguilla TaxID=7936 RepID=A0A0E9RCQ7_ANGAN
MYNICKYVMSME